MARNSATPVIAQAQTDSRYSDRLCQGQRGIIIIIFKLNIVLIEHAGRQKVWNDNVNVSSSYKNP